MTCTPPRTTTPAHRNAKSAAKTRRCGAAAADGDRWPLAAGEPPPPPLPAATVTLQLPSLLSFLSFADIAIAGAGHNRRSRSGSSPDPQAAAAASLTGHTIRNALQGVVEHRRPANISTVGCRGRGRRRSEAAAGESEAVVAFARRLCFADRLLLLQCLLGNRRVYTRGHASDRWASASHLGPDVGGGEAGREARSCGAWLGMTCGPVRTVRQ